MLKTYAAIALSLATAVAVPGVAGATRSACLPGVKTQVFARSQFAISDETARRLHADLQRHSADIGLGYGAVSSESPATASRPAYHSTTSILQSESVATVVRVSTSSDSRIAKIHIGNNCFAPKEDWRPYWSAFGALLKRLGYGPRR
ncbi:hypothetical protein [Caulobacter mirabilis]|uniref:Uncharacterized protein n=1 Tax=Caulobacter mirabilis TaxID=69666 RepID=A0A2D2ATC0_9CAUL|nr:hypothetical protein [Caulobacter mirabilis]ATQ41241.1 hypothetical protein CSW64_01855 [Caulobacter mirabilis]